MNSSHQCIVDGFCVCFALLLFYGTIDQAFAEELAGHNGDMVHGIHGKARSPSLSMSWCMNVLHLWFLMVMCSGFGADMIFV